MYHYDRGFLNLGPDNAPQLQTLAQQYTLQKITAAACQQDILSQANQKAVTLVAQLLKNSGYNQVEIKTTPSSCPFPLTLQSPYSPILIPLLVIITVSPLSCASKLLPDEI